MPILDSILPVDNPARWTLNNATLVGGILTIQTNGYAGCTLTTADIESLPDELYIKLDHSSDVDWREYSTRVRLVIEYANGQIANMLLPPTEINGFVEVSVPVVEGAFTSLSIFFGNGGPEIVYTAMEICPVVPVDLTPVYEEVGNAAAQAKVDAVTEAVLAATQYADTMPISTSRLVAGEALIASALIASLDAGKITSGILQGIIVRTAEEDEKRIELSPTIDGGELQFWDDAAEDDVIVLCGKINSSVAGGIVGLDIVAMDGNNVEDLGVGFSIFRPVENGYSQVGIVRASYFDRGPAAMSGALAGSTLVEGLSDNVTKSVRVNFSEQQFVAYNPRFDTAPVVVATPVTSLPSGTTVEVGVSAVDVDGFTLYIRRNEASGPINDTTVNWFAFQRDTI